MGNHRCFITHGHLYLVDVNLDKLIARTKEMECDMVLFGHTHQPVYKTIDGITVVNPGSVSFPRNGDIMIPTYCVYENDEFTFHHAKTKEALPDLFAPKPPKKSLFARLFKK